jgi:hypothetical protein
MFTAGRPPSDRAYMQKSISPITQTADKPARRAYVAETYGSRLFSRDEPAGGGAYVAFGRGNVMIWRVQSFSPEVRSRIGERKPSWPRTQRPWRTWKVREGARTEASNGLQPPAGRRGRGPNRRGRMPSGPQARERRFAAASGMTRARPIRRGRMPSGPQARATGLSVGRTKHLDPRNRVRPGRPAPSGLAPATRPTRPRPGDPPHAASPRRPAPRGLAPATRPTRPRPDSPQPSPLRCPHAADRSAEDAGEARREWQPPSGAAIQPPEPHTLAGRAHNQSLAPSQLPLPRAARRARRSSARSPARSRP